VTIRRVIVLMYWHLHKCGYPAVKVRCSSCPAELAMQPQHLALEGFSVICCECYLAIGARTEYGGIMDGGFLFRSSGSMPEQLVEHMRAIVARHRREIAIAGN
jgi:hypothetical protein